MRTVPPEDSALHGGSMTEQEVVVDVGRGIQLCYAQCGDADNQPLILIAGLRQQLVSWPDEFVAALAARGFRVTRFDNRDSGRSTHMNYPPPNPADIFRSGDGCGRYTVADMAADTVGLLDALGYRDAHLVGVSMGGMIAQTVAARFPGRARTLTSIMSATGAFNEGAPAVSAWRRLLMSPPPRARSEAMDRAVATYRGIGSHRHLFDENDVRLTAGLEWDRAMSATDALARQMAAVFASGDRTDELRSVKAPTLVIHGDHDRMVAPSGGRATARAIAGARFETIPGMGHDLPRAAWPRLTDLITEHSRRYGTMGHAFVDEQRSDS